MKNKKRIKILEEQVELILEMLLGEEEVVVEEEQDFEVGKWYKSDYGITARFKGRKNNMGHYSLVWGDNWYMEDFKRWRLATFEEVKEVLTRRCKELGLFDGEFECLVNGNISEEVVGRIAFFEKEDLLIIGNKVAYKKGKFADTRHECLKTEKEFIFKESELVEIENYVRFLDRTNVQECREIILDILNNKR